MLLVRVPKVDPQQSVGSRLQQQEHRSRSQVELNFNAVLKVLIYICCLWFQSIKAFVVYASHRWKTIISVHEA